MHLSFQFVFENVDQFIDHWSSKYNYNVDCNKYMENIGKPLTKDSIQEMYEWKNGGVISEDKQNSIERNYPIVYDGDRESRYLDRRQNGGAIWNIFYLHCLDHNEWPIYDQHTHRAMRYLETGRIEEIPGSNKQKYKSYKDEYKPFIDTFKIVDRRKLDKAFFAFGKFLKAVKPYCSQPALNQSTLR